MVSSIKSLDRPLVETFSPFPGLILQWGYGPFPATPDATEVFEIFASLQPHPTLLLSSDPEYRPSDQGFTARLLVTGEVLHLHFHSVTLGGRREHKLPLRRSLSASGILALESLRQCPFAGSSKALALNARAHDLLAEAVAACDPSSAGPSDDERLHRAAALLRQSLQETPRLDALARRCGLSESSLKRGFRRVYKTSPLAYLRQIRMEAARELIASGRVTILEAAAQVGYDNPSNFSYAFRRVFGQNPKALQLTLRR